MSRRVKKFQVPKISPEAMTPQIQALVDYTNQLAEQAQAAEAEARSLKDELARLKRVKRRSSPVPK